MHFAAGLHPGKLHSESSCSACFKTAGPGRAARPALRSAKGGRFMLRLHRSARQRLPACIAKYQALNLIGGVQVHRPSPAAGTLIQSSVPGPRLVACRVAAAPEPATAGTGGPNAPGAGGSGASGGGRVGLGGDSGPTQPEDDSEELLSISEVGLAVTPHLEVWSAARVQTVSAADWSQSSSVLIGHVVLCRRSCWPRRQVSSCLQTLLRLRSQAACGAACWTATSACR